MGYDRIICAIDVVAAPRRADLIVMGTHGRTGIKHALIGSVAERVVRHAPCPVLVVRASGTPLRGACARPSAPTTLTWRKP